VLAGLLISLALTGCAPDTITQLPLICERQVQVPYRATFPASSDGAAWITARFGRSEKQLRHIADWGCDSWYARGGLVGLISRCTGAIGVAVFATRPEAPRRVRIFVAGGAV
jgi:hypothetical protein